MEKVSTKQQLVFVPTGNVPTGAEVVVRNIHRLPGDAQAVEVSEEKIVVGFGSLDFKSAIIAGFSVWGWNPIEP